MMLRHSTGIGERFTARWYLSILGNGALWLIIAIDAWYLWPSSLGGATTVVIVSGSSMEPTFSDGDLVIAREGPVDIGDIVVYQPAEIGGARVVHRIIGGDPIEGYQIQGDNNGWVDQWSPTQDEIVGRVDVHLPGGGRLAQAIISPWLWGFVLLGAVVLILWPDEFSHGERDEEDDEADAATGRDPRPARTGRFP
jgi:signal peptidase